MFLNILFLNKIFYLKGGSEKVFFEEIALLERKHHNVIPFSRKHPENISSKYNNYFADDMNLNKKLSLRTLRDVKEIIYSKNAKIRLDSLLKERSIDLAHAHNIYGLLTTSVLDELHRRSIPIVLSLHDYKIICPNYQFFCRGSICEECRPNRFYKAVINKCVHGNIFILLFMQWKAILIQSPENTLKMSPNL